MAKLRPLVQVATVCETVIEEADHVASVIRVIDTLYLNAPPGVPPGVAAAVQLKAFISLKSGDVVGEYDVDLVLRSPSGKKSTFPKWHIAFLGNEAGANATVNLVLEVKEWGLFWFDVVWEGEVLTSFPLRLVEGAKPGQQETVTQSATMR